ncbi:cation:proton antiporter [Paludisphaera mucosa]|uniref:Cation:proton antiporter n=1 Tax=Paludisphaera mucosa TaxID=3030827 RepID=A0ABT6F549_9BACT|nr:cation:proton antiporter [Paludisphaera mucosa]MDG3002701.1 cation:proton antiporter [Paludisphaera mucosa]
MHDVDLIVTLTGGLAAALVLGYITFKLRLSPIVGYLLAGIAVGPTTPGFTADQNLANQLAEVGVILLMFGVGLQFHLKELLAVKRVALPGALCQFLAATLVGTVIGLVHGWDWQTGLVFGLAIAVASTVVAVRVLSDNGDLHTQTGHIAVGWLVVEDLLTVLVLVMLPVVFGPGEKSLGVVATAVGLAVVKVAVMVALTFVVGERVIPWVLDRAAGTRSRELFTLTVLVVALGIAVTAAKLFDVSMALGAFLAGMVVGRSQFSLRAATEALPMRDAFAVIFFVSVGMLFHPRSLLHSPGLIGATLFVILVVNPLAAGTMVKLLGYPLRAAVSVGVALAQIGEFSFILASAGRSLKLLDDEASNVLIAASIITITLNPVLYRLIGPIETWLKRYFKDPLPVENRVKHDLEEPEETGRHRVVVIGYGPVGKTLTRLLRDNRIDPVVIELNMDTVRRLEGEGVRALYGDAMHREVLEHAGADKAVGLILSSSTMSGGKETIRLAREINPDVFILARTTYLREVCEMRGAGADSVFSGEGEVALAMTESLLNRLGATPDQIDRERARVHAEFSAMTRPADEPVPGTPPSSERADGEASVAAKERPQPVPGPPELSSARRENPLGE